MSLSLRDCVCNSTCLHVAYTFVLHAPAYFYQAHSRIGAELDPHSVLFRDLVAHSIKDAAAQASFIIYMDYILHTDVIPNSFCEIAWVRI